MTHHFPGSVCYPGERSQTAMCAWHHVELCSSLHLGRVPRVPAVGGFSVFALSPRLVWVERWKKEMPQSMERRCVADGVGDRVTVMQ